MTGKKCLGFISSGTGRQLDGVANKDCGTRNKITSERSKDRGKPLEGRETVFPLYRIS